MLVKSIEKKIKINKAIAIATIIAALIMVISAFVFSYRLIENSRKSIYILDNGVPVLVKQTDLSLNRPVEYKAQIELFHRLFFTLAPDDSYIKDNIEKSLYLIDDTGKREYNNLKEKGFYNQVISSNSMVSIQTDSIKLNLQEMKFTYYGKEVINRRSQLLIRKLISEGYLKDIQRTPNNAHGVLIENWRILNNEQISSQERYGL
ncbi:conjugative transposon protein TraK [Riemerella columbipharyngis]|uniref:Bacteroides conjugative transposon TraK protein n=1 Tax=Riemerella columbipharyngis TaxID=1071918 RepID=A0A1G6ZBM9_9FLAO|nr:conjugative transposon protein TraK [Riemerella columbipharyngis]SDD99941.1 Bacteroides conjugative transposon TraK protein [Riemerella columbipharyngis]